MATEQTITKAIAEQYFKARLSVDLTQFTLLDDEAAEIISKKESCGLDLSGLIEISNKTAVSLSRHKDSLFLNGLVNISESVADALSKLRGPQLYLNGLPHLSDSIADALSKYRKGLSLEGITDITAYQAAKLGRVREKSVGFLYLGGLTQISDEVASGLSKHKGACLGLSSVKKLSDKSLDCLIKIRGGLDLTGLSECSDSALKRLKNFRDAGNSLYLPETLRQQIM